jgi:L-ascorbate metabolism protein UlaG (beta-lactamase superfamily)
MAIARDFELTWLGHAAFRLRTPGDRIVLFDPWIENPACPANLEPFDRIDLILISHGHKDHLGQAVELAHQHAPEVVGIFECCLWLERQGVQNTRPMNKGGTQTVAGDVQVTMVHADHSSGIREGDRVVYGGEAVGYVLTLENGFRIYHAGDTNVFGDMRLIHELYEPDLALLPIGGLFTMSPREAAKSIELLRPRHVVPMHYGTFPPLVGTPDELKTAVTSPAEVQIHALQPGETLR